MLGTVMTDAAWAALAEARRRDLLERLRLRPHTVGELARALGCSQPLTSKHLRVLRHAGLVRAQRRAQQRVYSLDPAQLAALDAWLAPYRQLWNARLDALDRHLAQQAEPR